MQSYWQYLSSKMCISNEKLKKSNMVNNNLFFELYSFLFEISSLLLFDFIPLSYIYIKQNQFITTCIKSGWTANFSDDEGN